MTKTTNPIRIHLLLIGLVCGMCGCNEQQESVRHRQCETELSKIISRIEAGERVSEDDVADFISRSSELERDDERKKLLRTFETKLFAVRINGFRLRQQLNTIYVIKNAAQRLQDVFKDDSPDDDWRIRMELLVWIKSQFDRIERTEPSTQEMREKKSHLLKIFMMSWPIYSKEVNYLMCREWIKHNPLFHRGELDEHTLWRQIVNGDKDHIWRSVLEKCVREIDNVRYSSEFKNRYRKELEKFVGMPLDNDGFWNIPKRKDTFRSNHDIEVNVDL